MKDRVALKKSLIPADSTSPGSAPARPMGSASHPVTQISGVLDRKTGAPARRPTPPLPGRELPFNRAFILAPPAGGVAKSSADFTPFFIPPVRHPGYACRRRKDTYAEASRTGLWNFNRWIWSRT